MRIEVECAACGKSIQVIESVFNKRKSGDFYCDRKCLSVGFREKNKGSNNPFYGKKHSPETISKMSGEGHWNYGNRTALKATGICKHCNGIFEYNPKDGDRIFCSLECRWDHDRSTRIERPCSQCGKTVIRPACSAQQELFFCDYHCQAKYRGTTQPSGEGAYWFGKRMEETPNWRGGLSFEPYSKYFGKDLKQSIRRRDDFTCQLCGTPQSQLDRSLDVHHIDYKKTNCAEENLISLCRSCHTKTNGNRKFWEKHFKSLMNKRQGATTIPKGSTLQANGSGSAGHPKPFRRVMI